MREKKILFERLSSRIPAMMARIKAEVDRADEDSI
jgi:hypothetical protein